MQRQSKVEKIIHPTKLDITVHHGLAGDKPTRDMYGQEAHGTGFSFYTHYHPKTNLELFTNFQEMAIAVGPVAESGYNDVTRRETEITVNGVINGKKVIDQVFYGLVDFAVFLKKHDVDVNWFEQIKQEKLEKKIAKKKPVESTLTDLHVRGFMNGDKIADNEVHNTKELLSVLNKHSKGAKFTLVKDDEVVMPKAEASLLAEVLVKSQLFDLMMNGKSARNPSGVTVEDVTNGEPGQVLSTTKRM